MVWSAVRREAYSHLESLLAGQGVSPMPLMARTDRGKPFFPDRPDLHFSLSHSGEWSLCAVSDWEVGCDVELVRPRRPGFPRYCLSDGEFAWFQARGGRWEDFYTLWTLKEARAKCTGEGLVRPVREIAVPLIPPGESGAADGFRFTALAGKGWRGAVCEKM